MGSKASTGIHEVGEVPFLPQYIGGRGDGTILTGIVSFGVVAVLLELAPVASIFFAFTNTVGAALWASDLERSQPTTAPKLQEEAARAE